MNAKSRQEIDISFAREDNGCLVDLTVFGCPSRRGKIRNILDLGDSLLFVVPGSAQRI